MLKHLLLRKRAFPRDATIQSEPLRQRLQPFQFLAAADMLETPRQIARQEGKGLQQGIVTFLFNGAPDT